MFSNPIISYACQNPQKSFLQKVSTQIADLGNGITMESTITEYHKNSRSKTRTAVKTTGQQPAAKTQPLQKQGSRMALITHQRNYDVQQNRRNFLTPKYSNLWQTTPKENERTE